MTIACFVYHATRYSGAAFQALLLAEHMPEERFIVFNLCNAPRVTVSQHKENVTLVDLPSSKLAQFRAVYRYADRDTQIFHLHGFILLGLIAGILLRKKIILKTTLLGHDDLASIAASRGGGIKLLLTRRISVNVVLSEPLRRINERFLPASKVIRIPNGIRLPDKPASPEKKEPVFCSVGVVSERKGTFEVIRYFLDNYAALPGSRLYLAGPDSPADGIPELDEEYIERCRRAVAASPYATSVIFTGKLARKEVENIYKESIAHIFFSKSEGLPNVILESMAFNCVPIMLPLDGTAEEIVTNGDDGFIIDDPSTVITLRDICAVAASDRVTKKAATFDIGSTATSYRTLYRELKK